MPAPNRLASFELATPDPEFIARLSRLVEAMIRDNGWQFYTGGQLNPATGEAEPVVVLDPAMFDQPGKLLPLVLHRASHFMFDATQVQAPIAYRFVHPSLHHACPCQATPEFEGPTASLFLWGAYILHAFRDLVETSPPGVGATKGMLQIDSWWTAWLDGLDKTEIPLLPAREIEYATAPRPGATRQQSQGVG